MEASLRSGVTLRRHRNDDDDGDKIIDLCSSPEPKRLKAEENKETELSDLPVDILQDILSRLPLAYLLQFARYTCPLWNSIIKTPAFADLHLSRSVNNSDLLYSLRGDSTSSLYFMNNTPGHTSVAVKLPRGLGAKMKYTRFQTCRGLLSYHSKEAIFISNPITGDRVKIPLPDSEELARGFGYAPISKKYKYVRFVYEKALDRDTCAFFTLGENSWRQVPHPHEFPHGFFDLWYSPVYSNGALYWITKYSSWTPSEVHVLSLDLETEQFHLRRVFPSSIEHVCRNFALILLRERVACIVFNRQTRDAMVWGQEVWVLMDEARDIWVQKYRFDTPNTQCGSLKFNLSGYWINSELYGIQQRSRTRYRCYRRRPSRIELEITGMRCLSYNTDQRTYTAMQLPFANNVDVDGFSAHLIISHVGSLVSPSKIVAG